MALNGQLSLTWNNYNSTLSAGLQESLNLGDFLDVTLAAEGKLMKAHRLVLSVCSPYFRELFAQTPAHQHATVFLLNMSHRTLLQIIEFIYFGEVQVAEDELVVFLDAAKMLHIKGVLEGEAQQCPPGQEQSAPMDVGPFQILDTGVIANVPPSDGQQIELGQVGEYVRNGTVQTGQEYDIGNDAYWSWPTPSGEEGIAENGVSNTHTQLHNIDSAPVGETTSEYVPNGFLGQHMDTEPLQPHPGQEGPVESDDVQRPYSLVPYEVSESDQESEIVDVEGTGPEQTAPGQDGLAATVAEDRFTVDVTLGGEIIYQYVTTKPTNAGIVVAETAAVDQMQPTEARVKRKYTKRKKNQSAPIMETLTEDVPMADPEVNLDDSGLVQDLDDSDMEIRYQDMRNTETVKFLESRRKSPQLAYKRCLFNRKKSNLNGDTTWRCIEATTLKCLAVVMTSKENRFIYSRREHNHGDHSNLIERRPIYAGKNTGEEII